MERRTVTVGSARFSDQCKIFADLRISGNKSCRSGGMSGQLVAGTIWPTPDNLTLRCLSF